MSKFESPLAKQLEREMDPEYRRKQMEYTNAVKAVELGWQHAATTLPVVTATNLAELARIYSVKIKDDLDKAMEILYGPPKTS